MEPYGWSCPVISGGERGAEAWHSEVSLCSVPGPPAYTGRLSQFGHESQGQGKLRGEVAAGST